MIAVDTNVLVRLLTEGDPDDKSLLRKAGQVSSVKSFAR